MKTKIIFAASVFWSSLSFAQSVIKADSIEVQPQVERDENGFKSCGVRVVTSTLGSDNKFLSYDFSVNLWESATGMMKAGQYSFDILKAKKIDLKNMTVVLPAPSSFWLAKRDDRVTLKPTKYIPSNDAGFTLGGADGINATKMIWAIINGEPMQVSLEYKNTRNNRIVAFQAAMSEDDKQAVQSCMAGMMARMKEKIQSEK